MAQAKGPGGEGGLSEVWELLEHGNLTFEIAAAFVPSIVAKLFGESRSFLDLFVLTAPLTISMAVLVLIYAKVQMNNVQRLLTAAGVIAGTAFLAQILGQGTHLHWAQDWYAAGHTGSLSGFMLLPIFFLLDYAHIYGTGPFWLSILVGGGWSGLRLYKEKKREQELEPLIAKNFDEILRTAPGILDRNLHEKIAAGKTFPNERNFLLTKLEQNQGSVGRTAEVLGMSRSHVQYLLKTLGITK